MTRIVCRTPSTGKPLSVNIADVPISYVTLAEAPDFSVPDASRTFFPRDPLDDSRAIRPGEIFFLTPLSCRNKSEYTASIEVSLYNENNVRIELASISVPAKDTAFIPLQGRSIFKRNANNAVGDIIEIRSSAESTFDVWAAAEEKLSSEHTGVE